MPGCSCRVLLLLLAPLLLSACDTMGKGSKEAEFKLPEKSRVLVVVDPRPTSGMPLDAPTQLGKLIGEQLYTYKGADTIVDQGRLTELRRDPNFGKMGIADIAAATNAEVVIYVDVLKFSVVTLTDGQVTQGDAVATVKVVDKAGKRLWPPQTEVLGYQVQTSVSPAFAEQMPPLAVKAKLVTDLAALAGRIFHKYDLEDKDMNPHS